ncbi:KH domain-containing protein [Lentilactobacillus laojiaonis]|uniref:KH domain-containing protein n=1 Tax=Lentilactobacillus laojiaonis TaxID=2883998 RepID=UPI001D0A9CDB|nr:KH domain-containing protein [Lentilactobacillus laojiaonis]UDM32666.1 KH domain-containing protein [Lentilactobacillus laojiaonis]
MINIDELIKTIIIPLVDFPNDIQILQSDTDRFIEYHLVLNKSDVGRVIGKYGHVIQTIRTIVYSIPVIGSKKVRLIVDDVKK